MVTKLLVASQKGGVGKTTTVVHLAAVASEQGHRVLVIDADPIQSVVAYFRLDQKENTSGGGTRTKWNQWKDVLPGVDVLVPIPPEADKPTDPHLAKSLLPDPEDLEGYDLVLVDSPPSLEERTQALMGFCTEWILVLRGEAMSYRTVPDFLERIRTHQQTYPDLMFRGILLTSSRNVNAAARWDRMIREALPDHILPMTISYDQQVHEATFAAKPVTLTAPSSPVASQYRQLYQDLQPLVRNLQNFSSASRLETNPVRSQGPSSDVPNDNSDFFGGVFTPPEEIHKYDENGTVWRRLQKLPQALVSRLCSFPVFQPRSETDETTSRLSNAPLASFDPEPEFSFEGAFTPPREVRAPQKSPLLSYLNQRLKTLWKTLRKVKPPKSEQTLVVLVGLTVGLLLWFLLKQG
ncbi:MAG: ParA family protein [Gemmataceae bacterium]